VDFMYICEKKSSEINKQKNNVISKNNVCFNNQERSFLPNLSNQFRAVASGNHMR